MGAGCPRRSRRRARQPDQGGSARLEGLRESRVPGRDARVAEARSASRAGLASRRGRRRPGGHGDRRGDHVPGQRHASALAANRDRRVTALLLAGARCGSARSGSSSRSRSPARSPAARRPSSIRGPRTGAAARAARAGTYPGSAQCGVASALCAVLLLLLLVFILETSQRADTSDFGAHGHLPPGVALLLAGVLGMLLAVIDALGRRMQQRNAAPKSPDLTPNAAPYSHDGVGGRIRPARHPADNKAGRPSRPGTRDNDPCRRQRRLQRSAIHDAEGSACGVLRKDFPSP